jgi:hypothetical protein
MRALIIVILVMLGVGLFAALRYLTGRRHDRASNPGQAGEPFSIRDPHQY